LSLRSDNLDSIAELYTEDDFRQLVVAIEATPTSFGSLGQLQLEDHGERGLVRERHPCSPSHFANPRGDCGRHNGSNFERLTDADERLALLRCPRLATG
jgi:hypothetical protein